MNLNWSKKERTIKARNAIFTIRQCYQPLGMSLLSCLLVNPIALRVGGGVLFGPHYQIISCHSKNLKLWLPNLMTSYFHLFGHIMTDFQQNRCTREFAAFIFQTRGDKNLKDMKIFLIVKNG